NFTVLPEDVKNPTAPVPEKIENPVEWLKSLYKNILNNDVTEEDSGLQSWLTRLKAGQNPGEIVNFFRNIAQEHNSKNPNIKQPTFDDFKLLLD
ncbi:hypothetical protein, partial [Bacillus cereus]|uniref:hypothetical protein n=1 Tax=Bacillus cereus TaxID=1396 RepID=UPI0034D40B7E